MTKITRPFRFKQFTVRQDLAAMKVGTDGVLLGAWAGLSINPQENIHALDIGSGTGLVALMLAQRFPKAKVVAIEPELGAFNEMNFNFSQSPFKERISSANVTLQAFNFAQKFGLIACNPPYFSNKGSIVHSERAMARSNFSLSIDDLMKNSFSMLTKKGKLAIVCPASAELELISAGVRNNLNLLRLNRVRSTPEKPPVRLLAEFGPLKQPLLVEDELVIETDRHVYTNVFKALLSDFYLAF